jgi:signal transduction histidine kinase
VPAIASELQLHAPTAPARGLRRRRLKPRWTLRLRLTLLYGALFLVAGTVLLAITYGLVANSASQKSKSFLVRAAAPGQKPVVTARGKTGPIYFSQSAQAAKEPPTIPPAVPKEFRKTAATLQREAQVELEQQRTAQLDALLTRSGVALGIMAFVSVGLGWLMAGRALRPLRTMGTRARGISERNLHERLALEGPDDEMKELGDTFDALLARLETAFESQRRFVANASHELRTPITVERTLIEVALADPEASAESLRGTCERVLAAGEEQERLIEALLTLARSQRGLERREQLDLAPIARDAVRGAARDGIAIRCELATAQTSGDPALVERLVANLLDNALHYNVESGWVEVSTGGRDGPPTIRVVNSGPVIAPEQAAGLIEPFRRLNGDRTRNRHGLGLGLSIVDAIATAHGAQLRAMPRHGGGLAVEVRFPAAA